MSKKGTRNALILIDFAGPATELVEQARIFGKEMKFHLWFLHVASPDPSFVGYEVGPPSVRDQVADEYHQEHVKLQELADRLRADGLDATALLIQGPTTEKIIEQAKKLDVTLIMAGAHRRGSLYRTFVGSVTEELVLRLGRPVLLIPEKT